MKFSRLFLVYLLVVAAVQVLAAADVLMARSPGCATRCGHIDAPYPFGLEAHCAIHSASRLLLNNTLEVIKISAHHNKVWVKTRISRQCYDQSTKEMVSNEERMNIAGTPYVLSRSDNKIIVLGCTSFSYIKSPAFTIGCSSTCEEAPENGSCSSTAGCCQMNLPRFTRVTRGLFYTLQNITEPIWREYPCNYVTMVDSKAFEFRTTYLTSTAFYDTHNAAAPVVMEWGITKKKCNGSAENGKNVPYACVANTSQCVDNDAGYACKCSSGYKANPYLVNECTDIDECENPEANSCYGVCLNSPGSFQCQCPQGTYGSPWRKGGCKSTKDLSTGLSIGLGLGGSPTLLLIALGGSFIVRKIKLRRLQKMKQNNFNKNHGLLLKQLVSSNTDIGERMIISLRDLEKATNNFDSSRMVGGGGHGVVFKGILDLHVVAIKKSKIVVQREIKEFINEVVVLSQVNHRNVVKLLGCCLETEVPLLVYEFISNGTLYNHLHVEGPISLLWADRIRIALEITRALSYLHSGSSMPIFHRDIKSSNILLDDSLTAKVSDFGASRYIPIDQTGVTTIVQGTLGYLDPMYHYAGRLTDKSDVFSFSVLLIELLTRKKPFNYRSNDGDNLVSYFEKILTTNNLATIVDHQVTDEEDGGIQEVAALAVMCTKLRGEDRPTMREVEMRLESLLLKKKFIPCITTARRNNEDETQVQYMSIEPVTNGASRQYTMEREILLSASYSR